MLKLKKNCVDEQVSMDDVRLEMVGYSGDKEDPEGLWESYRILYKGVNVGSVTTKAWDDGSALIERLDIDDVYQGQGIGTTVIEIVSGKHTDTYIVPDNECVARLYQTASEKTHGL